MKASELIAELQEAINDYGDLEVRLSDDQIIDFIACAEHTSEDDDEEENEEIDDDCWLVLCTEMDMSEKDKH